MKKNKGYTAAPVDIAREIESSVQVADFLPSPDTIVIQSFYSALSSAVDDNILSFFSLIQS
jgi:hypothetical protein